ncbi:MAG TPA: hypothetical protein VEQ61_05995 [Thermoleophilaceae bacterium]|nr:hypothetical protein [Thermoleophilaceae bacterium]
MRRRDPRRVLEGRRRARARVKVIELPATGHAPDGSIGSKQCAEVTLPRAELERIWSPEYLERLAGTYWRFLSRISLGLLRVLHTPDSREIVLLGRPLVLLSFDAPEYDLEPDSGVVTWRIKRGVLVAPSGRGNGYLRISVRRPPEAERQSGGEVTMTVTAEVVNFYPLIAGWGWFARFGQHIYRVTQLRIHVIVSNAFLRSLARLDLAPSVVGALAGGAPAGRTGPGGAQADGAPAVAQPGLSPGARR